MMSISNTRQLLEVWNNTRVERAAGQTVHGLFEAQAEESPDSVAAIFEGARLTYSELDRKANQLAHHLRKLGVKPGVLVGVFIERSLEMLVALLGTLKAGGAYVPMDPTYPPERLRFVLEDAKTSVVLTQTALTKEWSFGDRHIVQLDQDWDSIVREDTEKPSNIAAPEDLAYVIYTSGSTGKPKGVEIPHQAVVNLLQAMLVKPGLCKTDVMAAVTTLSFDISGLELWLPLCVGAKVAIVSRETAQYGIQLLEYLKKVSATVVQATPVTWQQLIEAGWRGEPELKVLCGGEAFPRELANELLKRGNSVWNMYGPTETTIWSAVAEVTAGDGPVPIGHPIANTQFYVLDRELQSVPIGVAGELCIAGLGLACGYRSRPELTAEKFIPNPFEQRPNALMYKTGDLVRRQHDGTLAFLGRLDDQVKLRGFRIRAGRDRDCAREPSGRCPSRCFATRGYAGRKAARRILCAGQGRRADGGGPPRFSCEKAARLHGASGVCPSRRVAVDSQRQARPSCTPCPQLVQTSRRRRLSRAAPAGRRAYGGYLGRSIAAGASWN